MRPLQFWLSQRWDHSILSIDRPVMVTPELRDALKIWTDSAWLLQGVPLTSPSPDCYLFIDSSLEGCGASLSGQDVKDVWRGSDRSLHINHLAGVVSSEAGTVTLHRRVASAHNSSPLRQRYYSSVSQKGGWDQIPLPVPSLMGDTESLPGLRDPPAGALHSSRLNVLADSLSLFKPLSTEWQLDLTLFSRLHRLLLTLSVDLFATCRNTQLPCYMYLSPFPDESAVRVEALSHS